MRTGMKEECNALPFTDFLTGVSPVTGETHLVKGSAKYHHTNMLGGFLLPYSPDLNATERVWRIIRSRDTHNRHFRSIAGLLWAVTEQFNR
jgi:transposase